MSRSFRKTPIFVHTTCRSERQDKKRWHKDLRAKERVAQALLSPEHLDSHMPLHENQVVNVWSMGKDGRHYWPESSREETARKLADRQGVPNKEENS